MLQHHDDLMHDINSIAALTDGPTPWAKLQFIFLADHGDEAPVICAASVAYQIEASDCQTFIAATVRGALLTVLTPHPDAIRALVRAICEVEVGAAFTGFGGSR